MNAIWLRGFICGFALAMVLAVAVYVIGLRVPAPIVNLAKVPPLVVPSKTAVDDRASRWAEKRKRLILAEPAIPTDPGVIYSGEHEGMELDRLEHEKRMQDWKRDHLNQPDHEDHDWTSHPLNRPILNPLEFPPKKVTP